MKSISTPVRQDDFEAILVAELQTLRQGQRRLERLFPKLRVKPLLRDRFLRQLAEVQQRADRLHAVLNPCAAFEATPLSSPANYRPAA